MPPTHSKSPSAVSRHDVITLKEASQYLRVSEDALQNLAAKELMPSRKIGNEWRFLKSALEDWLRHEPNVTGNNTAFPHWLEFVPQEALIAELLRRLSGDGNSSPSTARKDSGKERLLNMAGAWKDDPAIKELLAAIERERGRPSQERTK